jgi:hypothetical protein
MTDAPTITLRVTGPHGDRVCEIKAIPGKQFAIAVPSYVEPGRLNATRHKDSVAVNAQLIAMARRTGNDRVFRAYVFHLPSGDLLWSGFPADEGDRLAAAQAAYDRVGS